MKFDFGQLMKYISLVPVVVAGIEKIHGDAVSGADKKTLAKESLALATGTAQYAIPQFNNEVNASAVFTDQLIDSTVALFNAQGVFAKKK